jgi:Fe-Mn family superoxide dismutase
MPLTKLAVAADSGAEIFEFQTDGPFKLPALPYAPTALDRAIDAQTMSIHHDKHHAGYVANLNAAIAKAPDEWKSKSVEELLQSIDRLPEDLRTAIKNNAGGHDNHSIFWTLMSPSGGGAPTGRAAEIITRDFGGFDSFVTRFNDTGSKHFGSGWVWLVLGRDGKYAIIDRPNQDSPRMEGMIPILGNDVWEHAYYLRYQNKRGDYLKAWWSVVNWPEVNRRMAAAESRN